MDNQNLAEQLNSEMLTEQIPQDKGTLSPIDPNYTPPFMLSSRKAKGQVRTHLEFLKKLNNI
jgi:hypothetical protein